MADIKRKGDLEFRLVDADSQKSVKVDSSGRLLVSTIAVAPPATTAVRQIGQSSISGQADTNYLIPNGTKLTVQRFTAGCEANTDGAKVELYYDSNGNGSGMTLVDAIYLNGSTHDVDIQEEFTGNGTRRIVMRRTNLSGGSTEIFGKWLGFVE